MKKQVTTFAFALSLVSFNGFSQQQQVQPCNTYEAMEQRFAGDPQAKKRYDEIQAILDAQQKAAENDNSASKPAAVEYTIPVVFHILYDCANQMTSITEAMCKAALDQVNLDFARLSPDTTSIVTPFKPLYVPSDIKFMMATKDPSGNCISGVVRHYDSRTNWKQANANCNSCAPYWAYTWNPTAYLNVYVVNDIASSGTVTGGGIIVGYTFRPGTWPTNDAHDAIVYNASYLSGSSSGTPKSRSLTHEIGHWLDLAHTFGNTNNPGTTCSDDGISDTPITKGEFGGCASSFVSACTQTNPSMAGLNNVQNIMNYSDCARNFTQGQTTRMRGTLGTNVSGRSNLITGANHIFTGVNGTGVCTPKPDFINTTCTYTVCSGSSIVMRDISYNGTMTAWQWSADNGATITNATSSVAAIAFPNVGTSVVTMTVTNAQGSSVISKNITVLDGTPSILGPNFESFENPGVPVDWTVTDDNNDGNTWAQTPYAQYDQAYSFMIDGSVNPANAVDILEMPKIDVLNNSNASLEFAYSYRQSTSAHNSQLSIQASKDCGGTWVDIDVLPGSLMASNSGGGVSTDQFYPTSVEWAVYSISSHPKWQSYTTSSSVMLRFVFKESSLGFGNNMFIDAVNFGSLATGVNSLSRSIGFNLYPNPANGETNLKFNLNDPADIHVSVVDILGREVLPAVDQKYTAGEQTIAINKNNTLSKGVYFVNLSHNGAKMLAKLVIN